MPDEDSAVNIVVDTISNQDGLEYDAAILVDLDVQINEMNEKLNKDKASIYRAITRAKQLVIVVNKAVKNGYFHSIAKDIKFKDDEKLKEIEKDKVVLFEGKKEESIRQDEVVGRRGQKIIKWW